MKAIKIVAIVLLFGLVVFLLIKGNDRALKEKGPKDEYQEGRARQEIRSQVIRFGEHLKNVSLLSPTVSADIEREYSAFIVPSLLASWVAKPASAPGRQTSSPWPERIDLIDIEFLASDRVTVKGVLVYMTSEEDVHGGNAGTEDVLLTMIQEEGVWKIESYIAKKSTPNKSIDNSNRPQLE